MPDFFVQNASALSLIEQATTPNQGFRPGQLGALHAVLAHVSVHDDPATVCLPTGYGKTSVMMSLPFMLRPKRVLIVEPSDALRKQVASHYRELSTLRRIGAISGVTPNPLVLRHERRATSADDWQAMEAYDVIVSTPNSSSPSVSEGAPRDLFDLVIFDEAHHAPAETWAAYLQHFVAARFLFLTATPFRRDGRVIPGKLVYRYPVMRAVSEGAFDPVSLRVAAAVNELDDEQVDRAIAETALQQLREDRQAGHDHRLFARARSITAAHSLASLYQSLGARVEAVDSKLSKRSQEDCEGRLFSGELDGIVCVDMFGEGYDFPKLKIAALHAPHRSLVPTIQFIGRFARIDPSTGGATLITSASRVQKATKSLLREGVDLAKLIDEAALGELAVDEAEQTILGRLPVRQIAESDYDAVSPLALQLYAHVRVFHCANPPNLGLFGETVGRELRVMKQWSAEDGSISLLLTADENPPNWARSDVLTNIRHDAFLFIYRPASRLCYIGSTRRTEKLYLGMMEKICPNSYRALSYEETSRARAGLHEVKFFNVGLKNTTFNSQSETYRTLTGPQAERAVTVGDGRAYVQGHFFGSGLDGEEKETIGASSSSRIWSNQRLTVAGFIDWVERLDGRLAGTTPFAETHLDLVRPATTLRRLPDKVIAATWPKAAFKANPKVRFRPTPHAHFVYRRLTEWEFDGFNCRPDEAELRFSLRSEDTAFPMSFSIGQGRMVRSADDSLAIEIESSIDDWMPLADWLSDHPPRFYASDKSSFEGMNLMAAPQLQVERLEDEDTKTIDWAGCDIGVEFLPSNDLPDTRRKREALNGRVTVQERLEHYLLGLPNLETLFYDHRTGEAADFVAVTQASEGNFEIALYHCKAAGGAPSGRRVGDVYEVAGQLVKSVFYCDQATLFAHMEDRMNPRHASPSHFLRGSLPQIKGLLQGIPATRVSFVVVGVQPGIRRSLIDAHLADLMAFGIAYARQGGAARAYWIVSE